MELVSRKIEALEPESNVRVSLIDKVTGAVLLERESHNVITNNGRNWIRNLMGVRAFPASTPTGIQYPYSITDHRPRYISVGQGGLLSTVSPYNTQDEISTITGLEDPLAVTDTTYMKQIEPAGDAEPSDTMPSPYILRCITVFGFDELNNVGSTQGNLVHVSEAGVLLSSATPVSLADTSNGTSKMICYHIFEPIPKTAGTLLRMVWELRA